jgi:hypothetical protein
MEHRRPTPPHRPYAARRTKPPGQLGRQQQQHRRGAQLAAAPSAYTQRTACAQRMHTRGSASERDTRQPECCTEEARVAPNIVLRLRRSLTPLSLNLVTVGFAPTHLTSCALQSRHTNFQQLKVNIFFSLFDREKNPAVSLWLPLLWIRRFRRFRRGLV